MDDSDNPDDDIMTYVDTPFSADAFAQASYRYLYWSYGKRSAKTTYFLGLADPGTKCNRNVARGWFFFSAELMWCRISAPPKILSFGGFVTFLVRSVRFIHLHTQTIGHNMYYIDR